MKRPIDYLFDVSPEDAICLTLFVVAFYWSWFLASLIAEAVGGVS